MNTLDILEYGHQTLKASLEGIANEAWETPGVCGYWSVKEIVAHLASFERWHIDVMHSLMEHGSATPTLDLMLSSRNEFNSIEVGRRSALSSADVLNEYETAHGELMALAQVLPGEIFARNGSLPWYGTQFCLNDFLVYTSYGHKREHSAQVNVFKDTLNR